MLEEIGSINKWLTNVNKERSEMDICQVDDFVYRKLNIPELDDYGCPDNDENNQYSLKPVPRKPKEFTEIGGTTVPYDDELDINTDLDFENIYTDFTGECYTSAGEDDEEPAKYYETVNDYGKTGFWKFNDTINPVENKLQPQKFQHHTLPPRLFRDNDVPYTYILNTRCPKSASDLELDDYNLLKQPSLKKNAMTYRFSRQSKVDTSKVECLCRMCPFKRWVPMDRFYEHLGLAHGLFFVEDFGYIGLPPPDALFRMSPGKLKNYYGKCPKCYLWIRLGKLAGVGVADKNLELDDEINDDIEVVGLYTNYFLHFFNCSHVEY